MPSTNTSCFTAPLSNIVLGVSTRRTPVPSAMRLSSPLPGNCNGSQPPAVRPLLTKPSPSPFLVLQYYSIFRLFCLPHLYLLQCQFLFLLQFSLLMQPSRYSFLTITFWLHLPSFLVHPCSVPISVGYFILFYFYYSCIPLLILVFSYFSRSVGRRPRTTALFARYLGDAWQPGSAVFPYCSGVSISRSPL